MIGKNFIIQEFVDQATYQRFGAKSEWFIDQKLFNITQVLRNKFGPMTINNWHSGGNRNWSGLRTNSSPYYKPYSQHSFGRAVDIIFKDVTAEEASKYILDNEIHFITFGLGGIELGKSWLHIDVRNSGKLIKFYG
jgi:hypothetical protein